MRAVKFWVGWCAFSFLAGAAGRLIEVSFEETAFYHLVDGLSVIMVGIVTGWAVCSWRHMSNQNAESE